MEGEKKDNDVVPKRNSWICHCIGHTELADTAITVAGWGTKAIHKYHCDKIILDRIEMDFILFVHGWNNYRWSQPPDFLPVSWVPVVVMQIFPIAIGLLLKRLGLNCQIFRPHNWFYGLFPIKAPKGTHLPKLRRAMCIM
jgi:hypothetical protein